MLTTTSDPFRLAPLNEQVLLAMIQKFILVVVGAGREEIIHVMRQAEQLGQCEINSRRQRMTSKRVATHCKLG